MSGYRVEWPCCGDETYTDAWEPEECPFCAAARLQAENESLKADMDIIRQISQHHPVDTAIHKIASKHELSKEL